jgi:hypothetical protein
LAHITDTFICWTAGIIFTFFNHVLKWFALNSGRWTCRWVTNTIVVNSGGAAFGGLSSDITCYLEHVTSDLWTYWNEGGWTLRVVAYTFVFGTARAKYTREFVSGGASGRWWAFGLIAYAGILDATGFIVNDSTHFAQFAHRPLNLGAWITATDALVVGAASTWIDGNLTIAWGTTQEFLFARIWLANTLFNFATGAGVNGYEFFAFLAHDRGVFWACFWNTEAIVFGTAVVDSVVDRRANLTKIAYWWNGDNTCWNYFWWTQLNWNTIINWAALSFANIFLFCSRWTYFRCWTIVENHSNSAIGFTDTDNACVLCVTPSVTGTSWLAQFIVADWTILWINTFSFVVNCSLRTETPFAVIFKCQASIVSIVITRLYDWWTTAEEVHVGVTLSGAEVFRTPFNTLALATAFLGKCGQRTATQLFFNGLTGLVQESILANTVDTVTCSLVVLQVKPVLADSKWFAINGCTIVALFALWWDNWRNVAWFVIGAQIPEVHEWCDVILTVVDK